MIGQKISGIQFGDIYKDPATGRTYAYMGKAGEINARFYCLETASYVYKDTVAHILNDANKQNVKLNTLLSRGDAGLHRMMEANNAQSSYNHKIMLDIESGITDLYRDDFLHKKLHEIGLVSATKDPIAKNGFKAVGRVDPSAPGGRQQDISALSVVFKMDKQTKGGGTSDSTPLQDIYKKYKKQIDAKARGATLQADGSSYSKINGVIMADELLKIVSDKDKAYIEQGWETLFKEHGRKRVGFAFGGQKLQKTVLRDLAKMSNKETIGFMAYNTYDRDFIENIADFKRTGRFHVKDMLQDTSLLYSHLFEPATDSSINNLKAFFTKGANKLNDKSIQKHMESVLSTFGKGFKTNFSKFRSVDAVINTLWARAYNGGKLTPEFHSGVPDSEMQRKIGEAMNSPVKFKQDLINAYKKIGITDLNTGAAVDFLRYSYATDHPKGDLNEFAKISNQRAQQFDQAFLDNKKLGKQAAQLSERKISEGIFGKRGMGTGLSSYLGTMNISGVLGGALLTAGISHTVNKIQSAREKVLGAQNLEGMSHNSIATTIRRMALTQFGSAWLGFTKAFMKNMAGTFFSKGIGTSSLHSKEFLSSINKTAKQAVGHEAGSPLKSLGEALHSGISALVYDTPLRNFAPARGLPDFLEKWLKPKTIKKSLLKNSAKTTKSKLEKASLGSDIGDILNRVKTIRRSDLHPGRLAERAINLVRTNSMARYAAMGAGAAITLNTLAGTYRGDVKYDKEQEQGHIDIYTKEAFAKGDHLSLAAQRSIMSSKGLADKGIDNKNTSILREAQRFSLTDFGSRHEPFSPTSDTVNRYFLENQSMDRGQYQRVPISESIDATYNRPVEKRIRENMRSGMQSASESIQQANFALQAAAYGNFMNEYKNELATGNKTYDDSVLNEALTLHTSPSRFFSNIPNTEVDNVSVNTPESTTRSYTEIPRYGRSYDGLPDPYAQVDGIKYNLNEHSLMAEYDKSKPLRFKEDIELPSTSIYPERVSLTGRGIAANDNDYETDIYSAKSAMDAVTTLQEVNAFDAFPNVGPTHWTYSNVTSLGANEPIQHVQSISQREMSPDYDRIDKWGVDYTPPSSNMALTPNIDQTAALTFERSGTNHVAESSYAGRDFDVLEKI